MVFELELKARARRTVIPPLVEHMADMTRDEAEMAIAPDRATGRRTWAQVKSG